MQTHKHMKPFEGTLSTKEIVTVKSCALFKKRRKKFFFKKKIFNPRVVYTSNKQKL